MSKYLLLAIFSIALISCGNNAAEEQHEQAEEAHEQAEHASEHGEHQHQTPPSKLHYDQEKHLRNIKQLTFGGDNAEAYFSYDGTQLVLQITNKDWGVDCDQIFTMPISGLGSAEARPKMISNGEGRTTCSYFMPDGKSIIYASTYEGSKECPEAPHMEGGKYVWALFPDFDVYQADLSGKIIKKLTDSPGYDAEATISPDGKKIVFTSTRSGDIELYTMDLDGSNVKQVTHELGYDGGAFFTPDSKKLIFRASRPKTEEEIKTYKELLAKDLVQPTAMELFMCNVDGSDLKQLTHLGGANWAPYMHPSGEKVLFCSNHKSKSGRLFNIFMMNLDGSSLEQITYDGVFDSFPMFSPDGKKLVFSSNRVNGGGRDTNVFMADWVE